VSGPEISRTFRVQGGDNVTNNENARRNQRCVLFNLRGKHRHDSLHHRFVPERLIRFFAGLAGVLGALLTAPEARAAAYDARTAYNSLALSFEANQGQFDKRALPSYSNGDATGKARWQAVENVRLGIRSCNPL
jgi:hypothetical protein